MKAKVTRAFWDAKDPARTVYQVGDSFEGAAKRVRELEKRGFVKAEQAPKGKKTKEE